MPFLVYFVVGMVAWFIFLGTAAFIGRFVNHRPSDLGESISLGLAGLLVLSGIILIILASGVVIMSFFK